MKLYTFIKNIIDFILALIAIIVLSPLFILLVVAVKLDSKGPVFFTQKRVGKGKKYFQILKFRTMKIDTPHDVATHLLAHHELYVTRTGKFMRKYSLDEIPQLINIIKCDMSAIGPRPALWNQFDLIEERDKYSANDVKPGLTGLAQICGISEPPISDKAKMDGEYISKMGFVYDFKIAFRTIVSIIRR